HFYDVGALLRKEHRAVGTCNTLAQVQYTEPGIGLNGGRFNRMGHGVLRKMQWPLRRSSSQSNPYASLYHWHAVAADCGVFSSQTMLSAAASVQMHGTGKRREAPYRHASVPLLASPIRI